MRLLTEQGLLDDTAAPGDVGQRLGEWLDFRQAIALKGFIGALDLDDTQATVSRVRVDARVLHERFAQVRAALEQSILQGTPPAPGMPRIEQPATELPQPIDTRTAFEPFRRYASGHQRQMESVIRSLRGQLRGMLHKGSTPQRQLAALDAIFDNVLMAREARLLGQITLRFEKRFAQALRQHTRALVQAAQADEPAPASAIWLTPLFEAMRAALLAELDLRLQPLLGLIEAISPQHTVQA